VPSWQCREFAFLPKDSELGLAIRRHAGNGIGWDLSQEVDASVVAFSRGQQTTSCCRSRAGRLRLKKQPVLYCSPLRSLNHVDSEGEEIGDVPQGPYRRRHLRYHHCRRRWSGRTSQPDAKANFGGCAAPRRNELTTSLSFARIAS
jgi:hypothetical protein